MSYYLDDIRLVVLFGKSCGNLRSFEIILWIIYIFWDEWGLTFVIIFVHVYLGTNEDQYWLLYLSVYTLGWVRSGVTIMSYNWYNLIIWDMMIVVVQVVIFDITLYDYMRLMYQYSYHDVIMYMCISWLYHWYAFISHCTIPSLNLSRRQGWETPFEILYYVLY